MNRKEMNAGYDDYLSPGIESITIDAEGVLCSSTEDMILDEEWGELFNS